MSTATQRQTRMQTPSTKVVTEAEEMTNALERPRPMILLQLQTPAGARQPIAVPIDVQEWEEILDDVVTHIRLQVLRWQIELLRASGKHPAPQPQPEPIEA